MKFTKFGKALLMSALSTGILLSATSCVQSYSVGYLYVTGTVTSESDGNGIISGFKIDHNTGKLTSIHGLPISSGGANPVRAVLLSGSRFLYVLNRGTNAEGGSDCTTTDPCQSSNITQFAVGANGILTSQETFYTKGVNPFRMIATSDGKYIFVLDHDSPASNSTNSNPVAATNNTNCAAALGSGVTTCGDVSVFSVDSTTGRLQTVVDSQATAILGATLPYFPVPANPVDLTLGSSYVLTLSATTTTASTSFPYTGGATVYPYAYSSSTGQLTTTGIATPGNTLNIAKGTAIVTGGDYVWVLDNEKPSSSISTSAVSHMLAYTVGSNGTMQAQANGDVADTDGQSNPIALLVEESSSKWFYVANQGNGTDTSVAKSGIAGYVINSPFLPHEITGSTISFGSGAGPVCLVEDPSHQFIYTANHDSSTVTAQQIEQTSGILKSLADSSNAPSSYALTGPPSWCLVDGRTN
jgi:6-phosphogluconolactonase